MRLGTAAIASYGLETGGGHVYRGEARLSSGRETQLVQCVQGDVQPVVSRRALDDHGGDRCFAPILGQAIAPGREDSAGALDPLRFNRAADADKMAAEKLVFRGGGGP